MRDLEPRDTELLELIVASAYLFFGAGVAMFFLLYESDLLPGLVITVAISGVVYFGAFGSREDPQWKRIPTTFGIVALATLLVVFLTDASIDAQTYIDFAYVVAATLMFYAWHPVFIAIFVDEKYTEWLEPKL